MKNFFKVVSILLISIFVACSEDSITVNNETNLSLNDSTKFYAREGNPYSCNKFTIDNFTVSIGVFSTEVKLDKPISIYVCCGPAFIAQGGCAPVNKRIYDALNKNESKSDSDPIVSGVPIEEIIDDPSIDPKDVTFIEIEDAPVIDGYTITPAKYLVEDGYVYFELEKR